MIIDLEFGLENERKVELKLDLKLELERSSEF